jgi:electron transfer flavoprotein beta subunit
MKIAVCIKQVPETSVRVRIAADGKSFDAAGIEHIINPYDEYALEEAVRLKEQNAGSEITLVLLGPEKAQQIVLKALAIGADKAVHIKADNIPNDSLVVAKVLAEELKTGNYDLIFFGKKAVDYDNHQVGVMVAELLSLPCVSGCTHYEYAGGKIIAYREIEGGVEVYDVMPPAVFTQEKGPHEVRYPQLRELMAARKKPIATKQPNFSAPTMYTVELSYPPPRPAGKIVGSGIEAVPELVRLLREEAKAI